MNDVPERRVDCSGIEIAYWLHGEGTPLMLITGWGTPASAWGPLPQVLSQMGYTVVVLENRDVGRSSPCEGIEYSMEDMASDAAAVLDDAGLESVYLLGISMGGMIAQQFVLDHPKRVQGLILMATDPGQPTRVPASMEFLSEVMFAQQDGDPRAWMVQLVTKLTGPQFHEQHMDRLEMYAGARVDQGPDAGGFMRQLNAIRGFSSWDRLQQIKVPTLVMHGKDDQLIPFPNGEMIASRIPGVEFIPLDGVGHLIPLEVPELTLSTIHRFFPVEAKIAG